ncbi:hypothetical protein KST88_04325 [Fusobacterium nucleatum]|uniref:hypothetical protein n=1 Tax=Fusobacterium nucleatum TaxID=851 RepID=UPI0006CB605E|nr:hypothetical protein RN95_03680 [Fusobacterium nucleatum subsp. nucleatum]
MKKLIIILFYFLSLNIFATTEEEFFKKYPNGEVYATIYYKKDSKNFKSSIGFFSGSENISVTNPEEYFKNNTLGETLNDKIASINYFFPYTKDKEIKFEYFATQRYRTLEYYNFKNKENIKKMIEDKKKNNEDIIPFNDSVNSYLEATQYNEKGQEKREEEFNIYFDDNRQIQFKDYIFNFSKGDNLKIKIIWNFQNKPIYISITTNKKKKKEKMLFQEVLGENKKVIAKSISYFDKSGKLIEEKIHSFREYPQITSKDTIIKYKYYKNKEPIYEPISQIITEEKTYDSNGKVLMIENSIEKLSEDNMYSISPISLDKYYQVGQDIRFSFEKFTLFSTTKIFDNKSEIKKIEHKEEKNNDETFFSIRNYDDKGNIIYEKKEKVYFDKGNESKNYGEGKAKRIEEKYDGSKLVSKEISYVTPNEEIREIYNEEGLIEKRVRSLKEDWTKIYNGKNELVKIIYIYIGDRLGEFKTIVEEYSNNKLVKKTIDFEDFDGEIIEIYDENDKLVYREYTGGNKGKEIFYDKNGNIIKTEWSNNGHDEERGYKKYY